MAIRLFDEEGVTPDGGKFGQYNVIDFNGLAGFESPWLRLDEPSVCAYMWIGAIIFAGGTSPRFRQDVTFDETNFWNAVTAGTGGNVGGTSVDPVTAAALHGIQYLKPIYGAAADGSLPWFTVPAGASYRFRYARTAAMTAGLMMQFRVYTIPIRAFGGG